MAEIDRTGAQTEAVATSKARTFADLPFVYRAPKRNRKGDKKRAKGSTNWDVPTGKGFEYGDAHRLGEAYAAHLVSYLASGAGLGGGSLSHIVSDMDMSDPGARGVCIGFFNALERYILRGADGVDPFEDFKRLHACYARAEAERYLDGGLAWIMP